MVTTIGARAARRPAAMAGCCPKLRLRRMTRTRGSRSCSARSSSREPSCEPSSTMMTSHGRPSSSSAARSRVAEGRDGGRLVEDGDDDGEARRAAVVGGASSLGLGDRDLMRHRPREDTRGAPSAPRGGPPSESSAGSVSERCAPCFQGPGRGFDAPESRHADASGGARRRCHRWRRRNRVRGGRHGRRDGRRVTSRPGRERRAPAPVVAHEAALPVAERRLVPEQEPDEGVDVRVVVAHQGDGLRA